MDNNPKDSILTPVAADLEAHLRAIGLDYLRRDKEIPEWIYEDLQHAIEMQGGFDCQ